MTSKKLVLSLALVLGLCATAGAAEMSMPPAKPSPAFDQLKSLVGSWEYPMPDGHSVNASYQLVSGGSCLMETLDAPDGSNMITMYHMDGRRLMLDHYCTLNNVPHMKGTLSAGGKTLEFAFVSGANMAGPGDPHMHSLKVGFQDADHFTQEWTMRAKGKDEPVVFHFQRTK